MKGCHKMNGLNIETLRKICNNGGIIWTTHVLKRLQERGILRKDVVNAISTGEIIEQYPDSFPHPSCLILGLAVNQQYIHVVCAYNGENIRAVTAYYPTPDKFESDLKTRKERNQ